MKKVFLIDKDSFTKQWVCEVFSSGYHNGARCTPKHPHLTGWNCGWRYVLHLSYDEASFKKEFGNG
jgi:hypothetical protein